MSKSYSLSQLPYGYKDLAPQISEEQLTIHHQKHHQAYVNGANAILAKMALARENHLENDMKAALKELSWQISGHILHSFFWDNLKSSKDGGGERPGGFLDKVIERDFGGFDRFKKEFTQAALSVEGSGWAVLTYDVCLKQLMIMQIEKHNNNIIPSLPILLVLDVFEHAYYLDYKNDRAKFIEAFWEIVNWEEAAKRFERIKI